ncbi:ADP-forming succinate--CoA ligase subunit beta [Candidatus Marinimicrobia bacterium]|nr:ADP-forming succinate--CoA ligase subunit beta [Candidatus Neomarinimicrobiota bacterium]
MKIHEYQAKNILSNYNVPIQDGYILEKIEEASELINKVKKDFDSEAVVVKAQIHAGGRGQGGGVKYCVNKEKAMEACNDILGMNLVTHQTGPKGQLVKKIYITQAFDIAKEFYLGITMDRTTGKDVFMVSTEGGMEIEEVAKDTPEKIIKVWIDPLEGIRSFQLTKLARGLNLTGDQYRQSIEIIKNMYKCFKEKDISLLEINPLIESDEGKIIAVDAKMNFDSNALFKHKDIISMRDTDEEEASEYEASKFGLSYIKLDGNVGCMVNGAGLAMATMDIIKINGGDPANFLDVGGAASAETVKSGFKIILKDKNVKSILINIFGGIVRCDRVAEGVVQAVKELSLSVPVVVRLEGTNSELAKKIISDSGLEILPADSMLDAAIKVVSASKN